MGEALGKLGVAGDAKVARGGKCWLRLFGSVRGGQLWPGVFGCDLGVADSVQANGFMREI